MESESIIIIIIIIMEVFNVSVIQIYNINHCSLVDVDSHLSVCKFLFSFSLSHLVTSAYKGWQNSSI